MMWQVWLEDVVKKYQDNDELLYGLKTSNENSLKEIHVLVILDLVASTTTTLIDQHQQLLPETLLLDERRLHSIAASFSSHQK